MLPSGLVSSESSLSLAVLGKFQDFSSPFIIYMISVVFVYAPELYPTTVRSIGMGLASMMARIGGVAAPYIILTATKGEWIPLVI